MLFMKKIVGLAIILSMVVAVLSFGVNAAPTLLWDFGEGTGIEDNMGSNSAANAMTFESESFYHIFTAQGNDPYVSVDLSVDDVSQIFWVKARVLNKSYATSIELFGATNGRSLSGPECTHIDMLPNHDEWQTIIVNIPESNISTVNNYKAVDPLTETYWEGTLDWIRLDPMWSVGDDGSDSGGNMIEGEQIYIDYIAFFASEADAIAYIGTEEQKAIDAEAVAAESTATEVAESNEKIPAQTPIVTPAAPQTSDITSVTIVALILAFGTAYLVSKKK